MANRYRKDAYKDEGEINQRLQEISDQLKRSGLIFRLDLQVKEMEESGEYANDVGGFEDYSQDAWDHSWC